MFAIQEYRTAISTKAIARYLSGFLPCHHDDPEHWRRFADNLTRARLVVWLANEIANDLLSKPLASDDIIAAVTDDASELQETAELFLERELHLFHIDCSRHRVITVFREIIQHKLKIAKYAHN